MAKINWHYRNHDIEIEEATKTYPHNRILFTYKILRKYLGNGNYIEEKSKSFNTLIDAQTACKQTIDKAYEMVENQARVQRELTKNDFDGFIQLLGENPNIPADQIPQLAVEMLQAHYQRINVNDNSDVAEAINELAKSIDSSFYDPDAGYSIGNVLFKIYRFLEENYKT